jgi:uncharacterized repeat protein (TIGR03833 family)
MNQETEGNYKKNIHPGLEVDIIQDENRESHKKTKGIVKEILTKSEEHPYGIKVKLEDGTIGRVQKIYTKIKTEIETTKPIPTELTSEELETLIHSEESETLELKASLKWDLVQNQVNKELPKELIREIVAFLNSKSPEKYLLIGVENNHNIFGIERDLQVWCQGKRDVFEQTIANLICDYIGAEFNDYVHLCYKEKDGKTICIIKIDFSSGEPAFFLGEKGHEFWLRIKNTKKILDHKEATKYIRRTWKDY